MLNYLRLANDAAIRVFTCQKSVINGLRSERNSVSYFFKTALFSSPFPRFVYNSNPTPKAEASVCSQFVVLTSRRLRRLVVLSSRRSVGRSVGLSESCLFPNSRWYFDSRFRDLCVKYASTLNSPAHMYEGVISLKTKRRLVFG